MRRLIYISLLAITLLASSPNAAEIELLYFYSETCHWCKKMDEILRDEYVQNVLQKKARLVKIDVNGDGVAKGGKTTQELIKAYKVKGVPTIVFIDSGGKEFLRIPGLLSKEDFKSLICKFIEGERGCYENR